MKRFLTVHFFNFAVAIFIMASPVFAQTPDEHASHHPQQATTDTAASMKDTIRAKKSSGMVQEMAEMMKDMGKPTNKEMYPTLMQTNELTPEKRSEIAQLANKQIAEGKALLDMGMEKLSNASRAQDAEAIEVANQQIRRGQMMLESGYEGQRVLSENKDPQLTALQWFNKEMNLDINKNSEKPTFAGLSLFHYFIMFLLTAFAVIMIWMYFHKMKRANTLIDKLTGNSNASVSVGDTANTAIPLNKPISSANNVEKLPIVDPDIAPSKPNSWTGTLLISEIFIETPNVKTYRLTDPEGKKLPFNFLPGQFITVTVNLTGVPIKRSYTIASSPTHTDYCEITVKHEEKGTVSHYMHNNVHVGELMQFTGPSGKFTFTETHAKSVVFIGGGVGLTPMMSAVRYLTDRSWKGEIYFFFACKDESSIIFREEILYLAKRYSNLHVFFVLSQQDGNATMDYIPGHITKEILNDNVPDIVSRMVHICGPTPMMDTVKLILEELQVPKENVMQEVFPGLPKTITKPPQESAESISNESNQVVAENEGKASVKDAVGSVNFVKSNKTAVLTPDKSVLEASEEVGVNIDYSCRVGTCGICKVKLLSGNVTMEVEDALTEDDKKQNIILACQAKSNEQISVDA
jgi:ferredoxin-NADP reductase